MGYPIINKWMFLHDWNSNQPSILMAKTYGLKTVLRVGSYAAKLRREGHNVIYRNGGRRGYQSDAQLGKVGISGRQMEEQS